jgi:hypothetical protein
MTTAAVTAIVPVITPKVKQTMYWMMSVIR